MKLFLASEGSDPRTIEKLENYLGGFNGKSVVYIPTAKNGNGEGRWEQSHTWQFLQKSGMKATACELENYYNGIDPKIFDDKDIIWITGGACGYLMYWIIRTGLDKLLPKILEKTLYVGSSAGSMITGPNLNICDWYVGEIEKGASFIPSLKFVDFDFYPHYEDYLYDEIKLRFNNKKIYLVKNGEVVLVEDGKIKVLGEERVITNG